MGRRLVGGWRFWTDCVTFLRHWRWFSSVGRPVRAVVYPCAKAAAILPPFLGVPSSVAPSQGGWPEQYPYQYLAGVEASPSPPAGSTPYTPWIGPLAVPGTFPPEIVLLPPIVPSGELAPPPGSVPTLHAFVPPETQHIPEPSSAVLVGVGAGAAVLMKRRRG